jgi:hypothetical protein
MAVEPVHATPTGAGWAAANWKAALGSPTVWLRDLSVSAALSVWMGLLGPFGAYRAGPAQARVACYLSMSFVAVMLYGLTARLALEWGGRRGISPWLSGTIAVLVASAPASLVAALIVPVFFPGAGRQTSPLEWYLQAVALNLPIVLAYVTVATLVRRRDARWNSHRQASPTTERARPRLMARLSPSLAGELLAISAEDHYVRVHTEAGSQLVLMRFADAVAEVEDLSGVRAHRSWWVAQTAIVRVTTRGRHMELQLANGLAVPVARAAAPSLKRMMEEIGLEQGALERQSLDK